MDGLLRRRRLRRVAVTRQGVGRLRGDAADGRSRSRAFRARPRPAGSRVRDHPAGASGIGDFRKISYRKGPGIIAFRIFYYRFVT